MSVVHNHFREQKSQFVTDKQLDKSLKQNHLEIGALIGNRFSRSSQRYLNLSQFIRKDLRHDNWCHVSKSAQQGVNFETISQSSVIRHCRSSHVTFYTTIKAWRANLRLWGRTFLFRLYPVFEYDSQFCRNSYAHRFLLGCLHGCLIESLTWRKYHHLKVLMVKNVDLVGSHLKDIS